MEIGQNFPIGQNAHVDPAPDFVCQRGFSLFSRNFSINYLIFFKYHRSCTNPKPENGGKDCEGVSEKFILCSDSEFDCPLDDHSELVESTCIGASLVDSSILPFGKNNAHNTSSCQIECFKVRISATKYALSIYVFFSKRLLGWFKRGIDLKRLEFSRRNKM